jgi:hypothetical protein
MKIKPYRAKLEVSGENCTQSSDLRPGWPDEFEKKIAQNVTQSIFCQNQCSTFTVESSSPKVWVIFVICILLLKENNPSDGRIFTQSGHPVCDLNQP